MGLRKEKAAGYKSAADLKGMKIGVSAPGSSTNFFVMYMMSKAGLKPTDASYIGIGIGPAAIAAIKKGEIDALSNLDPVITKLEQDGDIKIIADSRTEEGTRALVRRLQPGGGALPQAGLHREEPEYRAGAGQRLLQDAQVAGAGDARSRSPRRCRRSIYLGDKALYLAAVKANKPVYSLTGVVPAGGMRSAADMLIAFDQELRDAKVDLAKTFDDRFIKRAAAGR